MVFHVYADGKNAADMADEQKPNNDAQPEQTTPATTPPPAAQEAAKTYTQEDIDRIIGERLKREEEKRTKAAAQAAKDAEEKSLKERQEWQTLAEKREAELSAAVKEREAQAASVQSLTEKLEATEKALKGVLENERKGLPKHIAALLDKLDVVEQLEWLAKNKAEIGGKPAGTPLPQQQRTTPASNNGKTPVIGVKL